MGGGGNKANKLRQQQLSDEAAARSRTIYGAGRGDIDWGRGELMRLYNELGQGGDGDGGGGGGGGIGYTPALWESETMPFYRGLMNTGGLSEQERGAIESSATAPITGMFEGLKRNIESRAAGGGGYGRGLSRLALDRAYAGSEASKSAFGDIARMIQAAKERGAGGLTALESEKRAFESTERERARAAAAAGRGRADDDLATRRSMISQILGLEGDKDLSYMNLALGGSADKPKDHSTRNTTIGAGATIAAAAIAAA